MTEWGPCRSTAEADAAGHALDGFVPGSRRQSASAARADGWSQEAVVGLEDGGEKGALRAQPAPVHGVVGVSLDLANDAIPGLRQDPAARPAIAADGTEPALAAAFRHWHRRLARGFGSGVANAHGLAAAQRPQGAGDGLWQVAYEHPRADPLAVGGVDDRLASAHARLPSRPISPARC